MIKYQFQQFQFCFKLISLSPYLAHLNMSTLENVLFPLTSVRILPLPPLCVAPEASEQVADVVNDQLISI